MSPRTSSATPLTPRLRARRKFVRQPRNLSHAPDEVRIMGQTLSTASTGRSRRRLIRRANANAKTKSVGGKAHNNGDTISIDSSGSSDASWTAAGSIEFGQPDVDIVVKGHRFPAHKEVLSSESRYFRSMFSRFEESNQSEVELKDFVDPSLMAQTVKYAYTKRISITAKNAQDLLILATYLQMDNLLRLCSNYMKQMTDKKNCIPLYRFTAEMGPNDLNRHAYQFILTHFETVFNKAKAEFLSLSIDQITDLISSSKLMVSSESFVYKVVMKWVSHDPENRLVHLPKLLENVHFQLMNSDEIEDLLCVSNIYSKKVASLRISLESAYRYVMSSPESKVTYWENRQKPPRWPKILVVMRMYWKNIPMEYYDFRTRQWHCLAEVQRWRSCSALVGHKGCIYLIGGEEVDSDSPTGSRTVNRVTKFDCEKKKWSSVSSMNLARRWASAVVVNDILYVIGGIGGKGGTFESRLSSVECLDLSQPNSKWTFLPSMSTPRSSHSVEVLEGKIFVVGGGDGSEWLCTSEVYDPDRKTWSPIASLGTKRWKCGLCALGTDLYAVGGMDSPNAGFWGAPLRSVEKYNSTTDTWTTVAPMLDVRFGSAVVANQGRLIVCGGFGEGKSVLNSAEVFDPSTNKWTRTASMRKMCGFVGGALIDRPVHLD